jgi:hypothetical protein
VLAAAIRDDGTRLFDQRVRSRPGR